MVKKIVVDLTELMSKCNLQTLLITLISVYFAYYTKIDVKILNKCIHKDRIIHRCICTNFTHPHV